MKLHFLRLSIFVTCLFFNSLTAQGQNNKLKMHSFGMGVGLASSSSETADSGPSLNLDIATKMNKHIFSFYFNSGLNLNTEVDDERFTEFNLTYGREWSLGQKLFLEGHLGVGYFSYDYETKSNPIFIDFPDSAVGFPLRLKLIYYPTGKLGIGINPNYNFNSLENAYSANIFIQFKLN